MVLPESKLVKHQKKAYGPRPVKGWGTGALIKAEVRHDDDCNNGHNSFAITGDIYIPGRPDVEACGCLHDEIARYFPELAPFIKWHLTSTDGPMHYVANTMHFASERDCWGKLKGEAKTYETVIVFGTNPIKHKPGGHVSHKFIKFLQEADKRYDFEVLPIEHKNAAGDNYKFAPKYTFGGFADTWHECPFDSEHYALDFLYALQNCEPKFMQIVTAWGEGKERELDKARDAAVWPEATDEELTAPGLKERLEARLPKLMEEFKAAVESLGLVY